MLRAPGTAAGAQLFLQQILPRTEIGYRHTEGLPVGFLPELFVMRPEFWVCHCCSGVGNGFSKALAVRLLCIAPLDLRHVGGLHECLLAARIAVGINSHRTAHAFYRWMKPYFDHVCRTFPDCC